MNLDKKVKVLRFSHLYHGDGNTLVLMRIKLNNVRRMLNVFSCVVPGIEPRDA